MKLRSMLLLLGLVALPLHADKDTARDGERPAAGAKLVADPLTQRALARLDKELRIEFTIPFPVNFDTDAHRKRPLALLDLDGSKLGATRPIINPFDQPYTVEWTIGPADLSKFPAECIDCSFDLDEEGEFNLCNIIADWAASESGNHQIGREAGESASAFFERARRIYHLRAGKAKDPAQARLFIAGYAKMAKTIQALRKSEARPKPGVSN